MTDEDTSPEARIAAVARSLQLTFAPDSTVPDFADYRDAIRPFVQIEILNARINEARTCGGLFLTGRVAELAREKEEYEKQIPPIAYFPSDPRSRQRSAGDVETERTIIATSKKAT